MKPTSTSEFRLNLNVPRSCGFLRAFCVLCVERFCYIVRTNSEKLQHRDHGENREDNGYGCVGGAVDDQESGAGVQDRVR